MKPKFKKPVLNIKRAEMLLRKVYPNSKILSYKKLQGGLVHSTYNVKIANPSKNIVVRLSKKKNREKVRKNNEVLNYLHKHSIPAPEVYLEQIYHGQLVTIMEFLPGKNAEEAYIKSNTKTRKMIVENVGKTLKQIHNLKIQKFWVNQKHEVKNISEWMKWTDHRIKKYLEFFQKNLPEYAPFLEKELNKFRKILTANKNKMEFVPLHWDYHLANINVDREGKVTGIFDFDNCMKGHNLADLGQTKYWFLFIIKNIQGFDNLLAGYKRSWTQTEKKIIHGYFLLHLMAVTRSIWSKQPRLSWIVEEHKKILNEYLKNS